MQFGHLHSEHAGISSFSSYVGQHIVFNIHNNSNPYMLHNRFHTFHQCHHSVYHFSDTLFTYLHANCFCAVASSTNVITAICLTPGCFFCTVISETRVKYYSTYQLSAKIISTWEHSHEMISTSLTSIMIASYIFDKYIFV